MNLVNTLSLKEVINGKSLKSENGENCQYQSFCHNSKYL